MKALNNNKGSALTMVLLIMVIMTVMSMGILSNSVENLKLSDTIVESEKSYYASEDTATIAIATIKDEVSKYYMTMRNASNYSAYQTLYNNFFTYFSNRFTGVNSVLITPYFLSNELKGNTTLACTMDTPTIQDSGVMGTYFHITSTSKSNNAPRTVYGSLFIEAAPIFFQYTTAPEKLDDMLLLKDDVQIDRENNENALTVLGTARIGGTIDDTSAFGSSNTLINDATVEEDLTWQLFYNQFDKSIVNPAIPPIVYPRNPDPGGGLIRADNKYSFNNDKTINKASKKINNKNIYCNGDLVINIGILNRCNVYATGNITINASGHSNGNSKPKEFSQNNIYAEGDLILNVVEFDLKNGNGNGRGSSSNQYFYAGGNMSINVGDTNRAGLIQYVRASAVGNIDINTVSSSSSDYITESQFYAEGAITTASSSWLSGPRIDNVSNSTFETLNGTIVLCTTNMDSYNKVRSGANLYLANKGTNNSAFFADGTMTYNSDSFTSFWDILFGHSRISSNSIFCAQNDLSITNATFNQCHFYTGDEMNIFISSGSAIRNSIMYAEDDVLFSNEWNIIADTMESTLIYSNSDFKYSGRGSDIAFFGSNIAEPVGIQVMSTGNLYSYEGDDSDSNGFWDFINRPDLDLLRFGDENPNNNNDSMNIDVIHNNIGNTNTTLGILADALYNVGFEHSLPEPIIVLPFYTEVFIEETYS